MSVYTTATKQTITTLLELGKGGEGIVYTVKEKPGQVAKIYYPAQRTASKESKLRVMVARPPVSLSSGGLNHAIAIAWPLDVLYEQGQFAGYLMLKVSKSPDIFKVYHPQLRLKNHPAMDWRHLHAIAKNLAITLDGLHGDGYVVGDINQKNVLVSKNVQVTLVDTDSFQVKDQGGKLFHCPVGVPEYTPPELQGVHLGSVERTEYHDRFGLAVVLFQLLMEGVHPFTGVPVDPAFSATGEFYLYCIKQGIFPYQVGSKFVPPPHAPRFNTLNPSVQNLFLRCFAIGLHLPTSRPSAREWADVLEAAEKQLVQCKTHPSHWYSAHLSQCHWCQVKQKTRPRAQVVIPPQRAVAPVASAVPVTFPTLSLPAWLSPIWNRSFMTLTMGELFWIGLAEVVCFFSGGFVVYFFVGQWLKGFGLLFVAGVAWLKPLLWLVVAVDVCGIVLKRSRGIPYGVLTPGFNQSQLIAALCVPARLFPTLKANVKAKTLTFLGVLTPLLLVLFLFWQRDAVDNWLAHWLDMPVPTEVSAAPVPVMISIPAGGGINAFQVGQYEVTFDEWDACAAEGACVHVEDAGHGRGRHPVINVNHADIQQYLQWLNHKTSKQYRLPTAAEWEYAARGNSQSAYPWNKNTIRCQDANYDRNACGIGGTTAVGAYPANRFGLYDTVGNVWEWVSDCWGACENPDLYVMRGGSYLLKEAEVKTVVRGHILKHERRGSVGFRLAKGD